MDALLRILLLLTGLATALTHYDLAQSDAPGIKRVELLKTRLGKALAGQKPTTNQARNYTETVGGVSFTMIYVEGGTFQMGNTFGEGESDEKPVHPVTLDSYHLGQTEVTQALWRAVMGTDPSRFKNCDQCPVENVNWDDAQAFIQKLNRLTGKRYNLPTEAQWEFAARGGRQSYGYQYAGSRSVSEVAWHSSNSGRKTHPVANKKANERGFYDMGGNVWEWCQDWYNKDYYQNSPAHNPQGPSTGFARVFRGGSWISHPSDLRVAYRSNFIPTLRSNSLGFRLARID